jgi:iron(III) transport system ATP-binding protein
MTTISLSGVSKRFADSLAVADVSLEYPKGTFTALLGPSGCGKTTLLRLIAGFEQPTSGSIRFNDGLIASETVMVPPERRRVGIVFQSYALWPHMDVGANVSYPLRARGIGRAAAEEKVARALEMVALDGYEARSIDALSGGQRQRVALARCLVAETDVILLDEPLANLDVHLRSSMLEVFGNIHRKTGATIVYVTHDQAEALALADRIAVFDRGAMQQLASPEQLYAEPANAMVAGFVGRGSIVSAIMDEGEVRLGNYRFQARGTAGRAGAVQVLLRPEGLRPAESGLEARVERVSYKAPVYETTLTLAGGERLMVDLHQRLEPGSQISVAVSDAWVIPG